MEIRDTFIHGTCLSKLRVSTRYSIHGNNMDKRLLLFTLRSFSPLNVRTLIVD